MKAVIQSILEACGLKVIRYPEADLKRRIQLVNHFKINKILDVGANAGQYATQMKKLGFNGDIISFEPLVEAFAKLSKAASGHENWQIRNIAIGDEDKESMINIAGNSFSSSLLDILPAHTQSAPQSAYVGTQKVVVKRLDSVFHDFYKDGDRILLKIDTQGFEKNVLDGATDSLKLITAVQVEMSIVRLYSNEILFDEMIGYLKNCGFTLYSLENGFADNTTGQLLQVDGIFFRS
jgi:FkbM family methyltransferase